MVFIVTCWNNKPTAGYLWYRHAIPFKRKLNRRYGGGIIGPFVDNGSCWLVRKCGKSLRRLNRKKNLSWNRNIFISKRRKWLSTRSSLQEIVNFVFNKSTQETRKTRLSKLILHKETPRRRTNPKNWLQNELWHKIPKKGILSLTKVKLTVGGWRHCFE